MAEPFLYMPSIGFSNKFWTYQDNPYAYYIRKELTPP